MSTVVSVYMLAVTNYVFLNVLLKSLGPIYVTQVYETYK